MKIINLLKENKKARYITLGIAIAIVIGSITTVYAIDKNNKAVAEAEAEAKIQAEQVEKERLEQKAKTEKALGERMAVLAEEKEKADAERKLAQEAKLVEEAKLAEEQKQPEEQSSQQETPTNTATTPNNNQSANPPKQTEPIPPSTPNPPQQEQPPQQEPQPEPTPPPAPEPTPEPPPAPTFDAGYVISQAHAQISGFMTVHYEDGMGWYEVGSTLNKSQDKAIQEIVELAQNDFNRGYGYMYVKYQGLKEGNTPMHIFRIYRA